MSVIPTGDESTPTTFTPAFPFVAQTNDFCDVFACAAMLSGTTIELVRDIAIAKTKHPARGPYYLGEAHIAALLAQLGFVATVYKELSGVADIPDADLILVDYNPDMEFGRHILCTVKAAMGVMRFTVEAPDGDVKQSIAPADLQLADTRYAQTERMAGFRPGS